MAAVTGYEQYLPAISLPDPNDSHVLAATIAATASLILTWNLRHFPANELEKFGARAETPDAFLSHAYDQVPELTIGSLANARRNLTKTKVSSLDFVNILTNQKLTHLANRARNHLSEL